MASNAQNGTADLSHQDMAYSYVTDYGRYGPLAQVNTAETRLPAFGDELQPGLYKPPKDHKVANPTPLGLFAFAYSVFLPGLIQMQVKNIMVPNILVGPALAYGGLVQLLAGMWYAPFSLVLLGPLAPGYLLLTYVLGKWPLETPLVQQSSHPTATSGSPSASSSLLVGSKS